MKYYWLGHSVILWVTLVFPMQWEVTQRPTKIKQVWVVSEMYGGAGEVYRQFFSPALSLS